MLEMLLIIRIILMVHVEIAVPVVCIVFPSRVIPSAPISFLVSIIVLTTLALLAFLALLFLRVLCVVVTHMSGTMSKVICVYMEMPMVIPPVRGSDVSLM